MKFNLASLQALKLAQLRYAAIQCGISSGGTKAVLTNRLDEELSELKEGNVRRYGKGQRVLSIDMGIRNLAYCVFDVPSRATTKVAIKSWRCISVSSKATASTVTSATTKESFEPSGYATYAYRFLSEALGQYSPTAVLIERQRYRSMGSSAVQEWTVRVNMFEGMLYAVLRTLVEEGKWTGQAYCVSPLKVGSFWLGDLVGKGQVEAGKQKKTAKARNKAAKVDIVGRWLEGGDVVDVDDVGEAKQTAHAFLSKWKGEGRRRASENGDEEIGKLDDLADCLLQGMAWIQWEKNKRRAMREGIQALDSAIKAVKLI